MYPSSSLNGAFLVVVFGHEFRVYCASAKRSAQLVCSKMVKILMYCSSVTLVECKSDLDKRVWMQLVDDSAMILGH
jgi:thioredoxin-related protein